MFKVKSKKTGFVDQVYAVLMVDGTTQFLFFNELGGFWYVAEAGNFVPAEADL